MLHLILGLCIGLLPALIAALLIIRKVNGESALLRERLAAEEGSAADALLGGGDGAPQTDEASEAAADDILGGGKA